ncbi:MAG: hypothetical protein E7397_07000, partial [Ruminococcaceae bacterium]|nr:hypothetical protein [Oscillospiraceae bacterium]
MKAFENKDTGLITNMDLRQRKIRIFYWLMFSLMMAISLLFLFPCVWILLSSFKDVKEFVSTPPTLFP